MYFWETLMIAPTFSFVSQITRGTRNFQLLLLVGMAVLAYVSYYLARHGKVWSIRPLEGLEAIREGIGRSAEMGRPILVLPGISDLSNAQTIAGLTVFSEITRRAAEIGVTTDCIATGTDVVAASEALARDAYDALGKPELYTPGKYVKWYGGDQFVYAVGAAGHMLLSKPAMTVFMGYFLADVIVTGETGSRVGAVQIGGTTDQSATPLMGMMCDYMLFGEEMYAASASITGDKWSMATLAGEDWVKIVLLALMVVGVFAWAFGSKHIWDIMGW